MENIKERVIIFGTGSAAEKALNYFDENYTEIIAFSDNNVSKQGQEFKNKIIVAPDQIRKYDFEKIVICSNYYEIIKTQLTEILKIDKKYIANKYHFLKTKILTKGIDFKPNNEETDAIKNYWKTNDFGVFNGEFVKKYVDIIPKVLRDEEKALFYVIHKGKKMYFSRKFRTYQSVYDYYRFLLMEQDEKSPHKYLASGMDDMQDMVVIDAGVAEGNFGLEIIEKVKKLVIIEADPDWVEALRYTFEPFKEKVVFYQKYLCDRTIENRICLDDILEAKGADYMKMDIEGAEISALVGLEKTMETNLKLKILICCYHKKGDENQIREILGKRKFKMSSTKGYMIYLDENWYRMKSIEMTRGILYACHCE